GALEVDVETTQWRGCKEIGKRTLPLALALPLFRVHDDDGLLALARAGLWAVGLRAIDHLAQLRLGFGYRPAIVHANLLMVTMTMIVTSARQGKREGSGVMTIRERWSKSPRMTKPIHVIGGGLAGSEAAWQIARA